jgi:hypothetical protein
VGVHVQHFAVGLADDHDRARIDTDDVVSQFAGEHGYLAAVASCGACSGDTGVTCTDHHEVSVLAAQFDGAVARRSNRIGGWVEAKRWSSDLRMANHTQTRSGRCEACAGEGDPIDFGAAVSTVSGEAQRAAVLRMLTGADDGHSNGISIGVLDGLVVNRDAHARSTVANRPFPARLCGESFGELACKTPLMDPIEFHREFAALTGWRA